jgi:hypothetical protein
VVSHSYLDIRFDGHQSFGSMDFESGKRRANGVFNQKLVCDVERPVCLSITDVC